MSEMVDTRYLTVPNSKIVVLFLCVVFGGVATGNIKAIDADSVVVNIKSKGFKPSVTETDATIGRIVCVRAVYLVQFV